MPLPEEAVEDVNRTFDPDCNVCSLRESVFHKESLYEDCSAQQVVQYTCLQPLLDSSLARPPSIYK
jgi:hypothetical protein